MRRLLLANGQALLLLLNFFPSFLPLPFILPIFSPLFSPFPRSIMRKHTDSLIMFVTWPRKSAPGGTEKRQKQTNKKLQEKNRKIRKD